MQYQMSGVSAPQVDPQTAPQTYPPATAPALVPPSARRPKSRRLWVLIAICMLGGAAYWAWQTASSQKSAAAVAAQAVRTATVYKGSVNRTIRLNGTTAAERYSSLIAPLMRGNRGAGGGRDGGLRGMGGGGGRSGGSTQSNASTGGGSSGSSSGGGSSSSLSSSTGGSALSGSGTSGSGIAGSGTSGSGSVASTSGTSTVGGSSALRSATSRIPATPAPRTSPSTTSSTTTPSTSMGSEGIGSTAGALTGTGTGGGGGGAGGGGSTEFGLVLQDAAKPGSRAKKGDVVAEFDRQYMMNRLDDYRASLAQMEASVTKLRAELEVEKKAHEQTIANAKADLEKARLDVKTIPVRGDIDTEKIKLAAEEAEARYKQYLAEVKFVEAGQRAQLRSAEIDLQESRIELKRAEANADRMLLKASIGGLVVMQTTIRGSELSQIQAGDQLFPGMMFMQIVDTSSMIINASVSQVDVDTLRIGAKASVRFDAYPGLELPATVYSLAAMTRPGGQRASFVKEIPVVLKLDRIDPRVIPDLSVSCDVVIEQEQDTTVAPVNAVFTDKASSAPYVYVKNGDAWERRDVQLGVSNNIAVSVRSGLRPGEVVATELPPLENKPPLEIQKEQG